MQRLQEQGPQPADEHRGVGVHPSDRAVFGKPPRPWCVVDAFTFRGALRTSDHFEQAAAQRVAYRSQRALRPHCVHGTGRLK